MNHKRAGWLFLIVTIVYISLSLGLSINKELAGMFTGVLNILIAEIILIVPAFLFFAVCNMRGEASFFEVFYFKKIHLKSALMLVVYGLMIIPLSTVINGITMLFVDNEVTKASGTLLSLRWYELLFIVGFLGPLCEELVFRGMIYGGMKNSTRISAAVVISSLTFGLMHMNFNQAAYAIVIGIFMALAIEATGSLWSSVIVHATINSFEVIMMLFANKFLPNNFAIADIDVDKEMLYLPIAFYMVLSVITTTIAVCVLSYIANKEERVEELKDAIPIPKLFGKKEKILVGSKIMTIPLALGIILSLVFMIVELVVS